MIYTVTFNPAVDYVVHSDELKTGMVNRTKSEEIFFGGKGINCSLVLNELGISSKALGFVAGFTGDEIEKQIAQTGIETDFIHLTNGFSRINVKIKGNEETELNGQGPDVDAESMSKLLDKLDRLDENDTLILAGSIPSSMPKNIYEMILERLSPKGVKCVVDATKDLLLNVLKFKPFLVKPNNFELGEMFGVEIKTRDDVILYAAKLREMGASNCLVSMAGEGAMLIDEYDEVHYCKAYKGEVVNSVGAGDSMVAGFVAGCQQGDYDYALRLGTACGGATAFSSGLCIKEEIFLLFNSRLF